MPSGGARDDHGDNSADHKVITCSTWKEGREKQTLMEIKIKVLLRVLVLVIETS
jgi:hypothetical protein